MPECQCCGKGLSIPTEQDDLCPECLNALNGLEPELEIPPAAPVGPSLQYPVTLALIVVNVLIFGLMTASFHYLPKLGQVDWGADWGPFTIGGQWWRICTSNFIHRDFVHLFSNLLFLWVLGKRAEKLFGKLVYLLFYSTCGLAASLLSLAVHPEGVSYGASGCVMGLSGGLIAVYGLGYRTLLTKRWWKYFLLVIFVLLPDGPSSNTAAHLGGLICGLILGFFLAPEIFGGQKRTEQIFYAMGVALLLAAIALRSHYGYLVPLGAAERAIDKGQSGEAQRQLHLALEENPNSVSANTMLSDFYITNLDFRSAEAAIQRALAANPDSDRATYLLGIIKLRTGRCQEARELALSKVRKDPKFAPQFRQTLLLLAEKCDYAVAGDWFLQQGNNDAAIGAYLEALKTEPESVTAKIGLMKAYGAKGMHKEADAVMAQIVKVATKK